MSVHVWSTDGHIAAYSLGRVHVGAQRRIVASVHCQHGRLHLFGFDDSVAEPLEAA